MPNVGKYSIHVPNGIAILKTKTKKQLKLVFREFPASKDTHLLEWSQYKNQCNHIIWESWLEARISSLKHKYHERWEVPTIHLDLNYIDLGTMQCPVSSSFSFTPKSSCQDQQKTDTIYSCHASKPTVCLCVFATGYLQQKMVTKKFELNVSYHGETSIYVPHQRESNEHHL